MAKEIIEEMSDVNSSVASSSVSSRSISLYPIIAFKGVRRLCLKVEYSSGLLVLSVALGPVFSLKASSYCSINFSAPPLIWSTSSGKDRFRRSRFFSINSR